MSNPESYSETSAVIPSAMPERRFKGEGPSREQIYGLLGGLASGIIHSPDRAIRSFADKHDIALETPFPPLPDGFVPCFNKREFAPDRAAGVMSLTRSILGDIQSSIAVVETGKKVGAVISIRDFAGITNIREALICTGCDEDPHRMIMFGGVFRHSLRKNDLVAVAPPGSRLKDSRKRVRARHYNAPFYAPEAEPEAQRGKFPMCSDGMLLSRVEMGLVPVPEEEDVWKQMNDLHSVYVLPSYACPGTSLDGAYIDNGILMHADGKPIAERRGLDHEIMHDHFLRIGNPPRVVRASSLAGLPPPQEDGTIVE